MIRTIASGLVSALFVLIATAVAGFGLSFGTVLLVAYALVVLMTFVTRKHSFGIACVVLSLIGVTGEASLLIKALYLLAAIAAYVMSLSCEDMAVASELKLVQQQLKPSMHNKAVRPTKADRVFQICVDVFMVVMLVIILIPLWSTVTLSFRPNTYIGTYLEGMFLSPWGYSFDAYKALLGNNGFVMAFSNSIKILVGGVVCALLLTIPLAYVMSVKTLPGRKALTTLILIPYIFDVGMIPAYLLVQNIGLMDHLAAVFLPGAISTYNVIIMRQFFDGIPAELKESARIDGCSEVQILMRIVMPLSKAIVMTIGLYYGVSFWNNFFNAMLYIQDSNLNPLPILLRNILMAAGMNEYVEVSAFGNAPIEAIKAASVFMSAIPMVIAYPFIQKYFTKGTMAGAVKG